LESKKWGPEQAADEASMRDRITTYPNLCVGSFCAQTGEVVSSLFMCPIQPENLHKLQCWADATQLREPNPNSTHSLFGISLTSVDPEGTQKMIRFFWPHALKNDWREIYLGSPIPGYGHALEQNPKLSVQDYVFDRRRGLPLDPQLRYYYKKGFKSIVSIKPRYFSDARSLDYGVLLLGRVPLARLQPFWSLLPWSVIRTLTRLAEAAL
jgi:hypothetical protein